MRRIAVGFLLLAGLFRAEPGWCDDPDQGWQSVGVRGGFSATPRNNEFHQYDIYTAYALPWSLRAASGWGVALLANVSAGVLRAAGESGFIGALGPGVILDRPGNRGFAFDLGGDVCVLSRDKFGSVNFNGNPLFLGHIGVAYRFSGPGVSYRFQHMSNGGLGRHGDGNTGVDLHMFGVSWNF